MKLITLNTWGGRVHKPLLKFFEDNKDVDIFCLQEIYNKADKKIMGKEFWEDAFNLYSDIQEILADHIGYFRPHVEDCYGLASFVRKDIVISQEGDISIYDVANYQGGGNHSRNLQYLEFSHKNKRITVANVHGLWNGRGKTDTEERLEQSRRIKDFTDKVEGEIILCGDFNLLPDTESVKILEKGMRNLVKEFNVVSTRSSYYTKPEKHADYIFITPGVETKDFKVRTDEVSDHLPLMLDFD